MERIKKDFYLLWKKGNSLLIFATFFLFFSFTLQYGLFWEDLRDFSEEKRATLVSGNNWLDLNEFEYKYFAFINYFFTTAGEIKTFPLSSRRKLTYYEQLQSMYENYLLRDFWDFYYANRDDIYWNEIFSRLFSWVKDKRGLYLLVKDKLNWRVKDFLEKYKKQIEELVKLPQTEENVNELRNFLDSFGYIFLK